jgi:hypothetical protein
LKSEHKTLLKINKLLTNKYFSYFVDDNILSIAEDKTVAPFAHLIVDIDHKDIVILALAVDFPDSILAVEVALLASRVAEVALGDPFYIAKNGHTYFEEEAYEMYANDGIALEEWDHKDATSQ